MQSRTTLSAIIALSALLIPLLNGDVAFTSSSHRLNLLPQTCAANNNNDAAAVINLMVQSGQTSKARLLANECLLLLSNTIYAPQFSSLLKCCSSSIDIIIETYQTSKKKLYENENYLQIITDNLNLNKDDSNTTLHSLQVPSCVHSVVSTAEIEANPFAPKTHGSSVIEQWNACCSFWHWSDSSASKCIDSDFCCEIVEGTDHHLILPALTEPNIKIRLKNRTEVIEIEQDGLLQLYDVSGVLWPAGYLLGLCLSDPVKCGVEEILDAMSNVERPHVLELGTGVGFASIALSKTARRHSISPVVFATDVSKSALDLTVTNAYRNEVKDMIVAIEADYNDVGALMELKSTISLSCDEQEQQGFDIIIGSSLQSLFDGTQDKNTPLWFTLDMLLKNNPSATVILSHVRTGNERIKVPNETVPFQLVQRIPGDTFNMKTRDGNKSDFEIVVLRRRQMQ